MEGINIHDLCIIPLDMHTSVMEGINIHDLCIIQPNSKHMLNKNTVTYGCLQLLNYIPNTIRPFNTMIPADFRLIDGHYDTTL